MDAQHVGGHAGEQGADRVAEVAPEPVDADGRGPPDRVCDVSNGRQQRRIDHRRACAEERGADREAGEMRRRYDERDAGRLDPHPAGDEPLAADPV